MKQITPDDPRTLEPCLQCKLNPHGNGCSEWQCENVIQLVTGFEKELATARAEIELKDKFCEQFQRERDKVTAERDAWKEKYEAQLRATSELVKDINLVQRKYEAGFFILVSEIQVLGETQESAARRAAIMIDAARLKEPSDSAQRGEGA